ncbi:hypothetical protein HQQ94_05915 [Shewanella sp. VB17]|uniref:hypothetical protein n=1 Tax=Shewanella sp. VB17 TaxID=2739432 RepID=UPI0015669024|nr:hypothetical protein [Shewanella sp. VB17]NRD72791.1 hypothetical protein [Shewanella sp. VB17]
MLHKIEEWIDTTNKLFSGERKSCTKFSEEFVGFYSSEFLSESFFVVVDSIPKPDFPELREAGLGDFLDMEVQGITYKNTYYIVPEVAGNLRLHFHELVHVAQWKHLGAIAFLQKYISEIKSEGYAGAPLEKIAYTFDEHFANSKVKVDVPSFIAAQKF